MEKSKRVSLGVQKNTKQSKKKKLLTNVFNYLKSDNYMFAPLISPSISAEQIQCISKVTVEVATTKTKLNTESANALAEEEQPHEDTRPTDNQTIAQGETVKHMVYHHRCSTPMSGVTFLKPLPTLFFFASICYIIICLQEKQWQII
ncbi:uncharacterized protein [Gossypium hirsutum]|uniref:Uncharacterized protein isoform X3 n=1 Tax=Gossypium hirsutum TaxID=3635 RepID=A0ABM2ZG75_GOSHI|nr:uncharacterized protein LOC121202898 isoform X3 [Gossypium hirsutum]